VPLLLGLAILCYVIGQAIWTYNENIAHLAVLFPTWADVGYLGSFPFVLLALLLLPAQPLPANARTRIVLNSLLVMVAVTTLSWFFILGPTILQGAGSVLGKAIGAAYPLSTLLLIFCLLLLVIRSHDSTIRPVAFILGLALLIIVLTDSIYAYQQLHNAYATGTMLDVGWPLGFLLIGLGARAMRVMGTSRLSPTPAPARASAKGIVGLVPAPFFWQSLPPFLLLPPIIALLGYAMASNAMLCPVQLGSFLGITSSKILCPVRLGVILGTAALLGLLILRQVLAIRQNIAEQHTLWEMHERVTRAELARERAERIKVERILALNEALAASQQALPHARILAFGRYQIRDSNGIYYNVYHREVEGHQIFECECPQYQQQAICPHAITAAALHSVSDSPQH
jgi:hypothetical protein